MHGVQALKNLLDHVCHAFLKKVPLCDFPLQLIKRDKSDQQAASLSLSRAGPEMIWPMTVTPIPSSLAPRPNHVLLRVLHLMHAVHSHFWISNVQEVRLSNWSSNFSAKTHIYVAASYACVL